MASAAPPACGQGLPAPFLAKLGASLRGRRLLVTGGAGFLGGHIVSVLLQAGATVRVLDVAKPREGHGAWSDKDDVQVVTGNLLSASDVAAAVADCWCVVHVASPSPTCNNPALFQSVNVDGTRVLLDACVAAGLQRFVYTSSASVVFDGRDQRNYDESAPPPIDAMDAYTRSKLAAEALVLSYNGPKIWTCAIRPHGIFGARDPHFLPVLAATGAAGKSKFLIGDGANLVDFTYVENVAYAHALAAVQLGEGARVNGQAYFITNREPIFFWEFITRMHRAWGYTLPWIHMPVPLMRPLAVVGEKLGKVFGFKPTFTTQAINYAGVAHYYSAKRAVEEMGYQPPVDLDEAIARSLNHYWHLRNQKKPLASPAAKKGSKNATVVPQRPITAHPLFPYGLVSLVLTLLAVSGCCKTFYFFSFLAALWLAHGYRTSVGATPRLFVESEEDKLLTSRVGRNILVTGANRGLGLEACRELLARGFAGKDTGATLFLSARDATRGQEAVSVLRRAYPAAKVEFLQLDLGSFASVRSAVASLQKQDVSLHVLIHNAGAMCESAITADGFESQWAANYLGHFYFTQRLLKANRLAPAARVVNVSSMMHRLAAPLDVKAAFSKQLATQRVAAYCQSKLAQIVWMGAQQRVFNADARDARLQYFGKEKAGSAPNPLMNRRTILSVHPGAVATEFIHHFIPASLAKMVEPLLSLLVNKTPAQGVAGVIHAALARELDNVGGVYLDNLAVCLPSTQARDEALQQQLWEASVAACPKE